MTSTPIFRPHSNALLDRVQKRLNDLDSLSESVGRISSTLTDALFLARLFSDFSSLSSTLDQLPSSLFVEDQAQIDADLDQLRLITPQGQSSSVTRPEASALIEMKSALAHLEAQSDRARFGLDESYTLDQVKDAFRRLARKWHPDVLGEEASSELIELYNRGFKLVSETYDRLNSDVSRQGSIGQATRPRVRREVPPQMVDQYVEEHASRWRETILNFEAREISDLEVHRMLEALDYGREAEFSDPAAFVLARDRVLMGQAESLIDSAKDLRQLENVRLAIQAWKWASGENFSAWKDYFEKRLEALVDEVGIEASEVPRTFSLWHSVNPWEGADQLELLVSAVAEQKGQPQGEVAREVLVSYIQENPVIGAGQSSVFYALQKLWLGGREMHKEEMKKIRELIEKFPDRPDVYSLLLSSYTWRAQNDAEIRTRLLEVFGPRFLVEHGIEIGLIRRLLSRFQGSRVGQDSRAAISHEAAAVTGQAMRAEALIEASLQTDQAEVRLGRVRIQLNSPELQRVSTMPFGPAVRYLKRQYGIEVVVVPADHDSQELLAYHSYFANSGARAAFIPANTNLQIGGYERKFSDRPVIVLKEEAKGSLTHEFAHFLMFEEVARVSEQAGIPHQSLEAYTRSSEIGEFMSQNQSVLWASPFWSGGYFSESDVSLYVDAALLAVQRNFQRLREEIFVDQMEIRVGKLDAQLRQKKIEHLAFELQRFEENTRRALLSLRKRVASLASYLSEAEIARFGQAIQHLQSLLHNLDSALVDMNYMGPMELILQREANQADVVASEVGPVLAPALRLEGWPAD
ncbi:MAG: J domain-containing protein [Bradymonadales bacterium]|nr:MAG: J domain-containing protein [Bradymonadales bacterium]